MQMIEKALEPEALERVKKEDEAKEAGNRHDRRAAEAIRKKELEKMINGLVQAGRERKDNAL